MSPGTPRRAVRYVALGALVATAILVRWILLADQPLTADDRLVALSAANYATTGHLGPTEWNHPPLRSLVVWSALSGLGVGPGVLRAASGAIGVAAVPLLVAVVLRLGGGWSAALLAGLFVALDPIHVAFSRQAVQEVYMATFALAGVLAALLFRERGRTVYLGLAGVAFGLGVAAKWDVTGPLVVTAGWLAWLEAREPEAGGGSWTRAAAVSSTLLLVAASVYLLVFLPWFGRGYGFGEWLELHWTMLRGSAEHGGVHNPYLAELDHRPLLWFVKPVSYAVFTSAGGRPFVLAAISNPLTWMAVLPALVTLWRRPSTGVARERTLLTALFAAAWLPFLVAGRPFWAHSALSVLPWGFAAVGIAASRFWTASRRGLALYAAAVVVVALPLLLLAIGQGLEIGWLRPWTLSFRPAGEG